MLLYIGLDKLKVKMQRNKTANYDYLPSCRLGEVGDYLVLLDAGPWELQRGDPEFLGFQKVG